MVIEPLLLFSYISPNLLKKRWRLTLRSLPILSNVFIGTFVGFASDKRSYYDAILLEVRRAKRPILIPHALSGRSLD